jgi:hypothetical protein
MGLGLLSLARVEYHHTYFIGSLTVKVLPVPT